MATSMSVVMPRGMGQTNMPSGMVYGVWCIVFSVCFLSYGLYAFFLLTLLVHVFAAPHLLSTYIAPSEADSIITPIPAEERYGYFCMHVYGYVYTFVFCLCVWFCLWI
ncbi:hypothetical protein EON63_19700 [archaeon]|nr:MAG: hypothetical protein EON63_19700 [archaeon]